MSKGGKTTTTTGLDPASQGYVDRMRGAGQTAYNQISGAGPLFLGADPRTIEEQMAPFMNPYQSQVVGGIRGEFDHLRAGAGVDAAQAATRAGAFGGSRHGVAEAVRKSALDRAQTGQIAGLLSSGYDNALSRGLGYSEYQRALRERQAQEPIFRNQQALQTMNMGLGPTGQVNTEKTSSDPWGQLLGLGLTAGSFFMGGPAAAAAVGGATGTFGGNATTGFTDPSQAMGWGRGASYGNGWGGYGG